MVMFEEITEKKSNFLQPKVLAKKHWHTS